MENTEIWKDIPGFGGMYQVSSYGQVKSMKNGRYGIGKERILKSCRHQYGYRDVALSINKNKKTFHIHRLVGYAFLGLSKDDTKVLVCHRDDDPSNNNIGNLFLGTHKENTQDMIKKGRCGGGIGRTRKIKQFSKTGIFIKEWDSIRMACRDLKISESHIGECCKGGVGFKTAGGFKWKYKENLK